MNKADEESGQAEKEALKKLREARKQAIEASTRKMKEQKKIIDALKLELKGGGRTVPELAESLGIASSDAMWYVAALKKYGQIVESEKDGSYFRYELSGALPDQKDRAGSEQ